MGVRYPRPSLPTPESTPTPESSGGAVSAPCPVRAARRRPSGARSTA
jgi:hypothetical protein